MRKLHDWLSGLCGRLAAVAALSATHSDPAQDNNYLCYPQMIFLGQDVFCVRKLYVCIVPCDTRIEP